MVGGWRCPFKKMCSHFMQIRFTSIFYGYNTRKCEWLGRDYVMESLHEILTITFYWTWYMQIMKFRFLSSWKSHFNASLNRMNVFVLYFMWLNWVLKKKKGETRTISRYFSQQIFWDQRFSNGFLQQYKNGTIIRHKILWGGGTGRSGWQNLWVLYSIQSKRVQILHIG